MISKFEEKYWDIDIEKVTVSHCHHIACIGKTGCRADSGGPLFMRAAGDEAPWYQIGILSFGATGCARAYDPTVYTRVSAYAEWISRKMEVDDN